MGQNLDFYDKFQEIRYDMSKASLEDVKNILDHYNQGVIMVGNVNYHFNITPLDAACLNARYHELTGQDHPTFAKVQKQILEKKIKSSENIRVNGETTVYEQLKNNTMEISNNNHILNRFDQIMNNLQDASLEDVSSLLNYFNGEPVLINGIAHHPFNDPISAEKLNARYYELTGQDHPVFVEQVQIVIDSLMQDKDMLLQAKAYPTEYFDILEEIRNRFENELETQPKHK